MESQLFDFAAELLSLLSSSTFAPAFKQYDAPKGQPASVVQEGMFDTLF